jgi:hypothetical protein
VIRITVPESVDASASPPLSPRLPVDLLPGGDRRWRIVNQLIEQAQQLLRRFF